MSALVAAFALDAVAGELPERLHPVRWMGLAVERSESFLRPYLRGAADERAAGVAVAVVLPAGVWLAARALLRAVPRPLAAALEVFMIWNALAARSLAQSATAVADALESGLEDGRTAVGRIVGRDTAGLDEAGVVRAAVESVAENTNDGVVAPLFYGFIGGGPLVLAYKMINTLDSMIGYRDSLYRDFGRASARIDDAAGYFPARLTGMAAVAAAGLTGRDAAGAWRTWRQDAAGHASPNAGVCESVFAGALGVRLGGPGSYGGKTREAAILGTGNRPPERGDIRAATSLMYAASALVLAAAVVARLAGRRRKGEA